jgi:inner membrane protein
MQQIIKLIKPILLAARIWILTSLVLGTGWILYALFFGTGVMLALLSIAATICAAIGSLPVLFVFSIALPRIEAILSYRYDKINRLLLICFLCTIPYGLLGSLFFTYSYKNEHYWSDYALYAAEVSGVLFFCATIAILLSRNMLMHFFSSPQQQTYSLTQINATMETEQQPYATNQQRPQSNKTLVKGLITGSLILLMMIPTIFVSNLITEREIRQQEVVKEVSSKWATEQTIGGPYLYIPYIVNSNKGTSKPEIESKYLLLLPENLTINGQLLPEIRPRSIYNVLLYKSSLKSNGNFAIHLPKEIDPAMLQLADAKICFGITDFKGIEEKISVNFNSASYELSPGLPVHDIDTNGLSSPLNLTAADIGKNIEFNMQIKIKGSEQLHFVPLGGNTRVVLQSAWDNPSFDGNILPGERNVDKNGFTAKWTVNKANLPFGTILQGTGLNKNNFAFGVSMLQPSGQYGKTTRSVKYAILFIGLTFSLFFIVEVMQNKPLHPVQYVLVGLALVIFYTLLLSFSEFILFDQAYLIAALATISLITLYAKSHFENWKTAALFSAVLCSLYGFIFILIRLEDTALLIGSIGLFLVLAMVMYASRKINWYNTTVNTNDLAPA